jgi:methylated-DNA-[protein]-cysteine S-methyltransferase
MLESFHRKEADMHAISIVFDSPFGAIGLTATDVGLSHVEIRNRKEPARAKTPPDTTPETEAGLPSILRQARVQILEYLQGNRRSFDLELDMSGTEFQKAVWGATSEIPYGETLSYGEIADRIGRPRSGRAVGGALHVNPLPLVVPCHRVIGKNGSLVGFGGGLDMKARLIELENSNLDHS